MVLTFQDLHQSSKSKHHQTSTLQLPQKKSPLDTIGVTKQKANMFESRTCKQLMNEKFSKVWNRNALF